MEHDKKANRRFKDFSHLFISSKNEKPEPAVTQQSVLPVKQSEFSATKPIFCITSFNNINNRVSLIAKIAADLTNAGKKVLLIDADFSLPRLSLKIKSGSSFSVMNFLSADSDFNFYSSSGSNIKIITIDADISDLSLIEMKKRIFLKKFFRYSEEVSDVILISLPIIFNIRMIENFVKAGNQFVILTPREKSELINAYRLIKTINKINSNAGFGIIINNVEKKEIAVNSFKIMERIAGKFLDKKLNDYGFVHTATGTDDPALGNKTGSMHNFSPVSGSELSKNILEILKVIESREKNEAEKFSLTEQLFSSL